LPPSSVSAAPSCASTSTPAAHWRRASCQASTRISPYPVRASSGLFLCQRARRRWTLALYIKLIEGGVMSRYLADRARPGDEIALDGSFGHFYLRRPQRPIVMVAGGTGLAPMLSILDQLAAQGAATPVRLLYGSAAPGDVFALHQLQAYDAKGVIFDLECSVVTSTGGWTGAVGHVTQLLRPEHVAGADVYLCGPPAMIAAAQRRLAAFAVPARRIPAETFLPS
jgi:benzoate/toluate 1,2-dioxygenase reductase subunit